ncbi:glycine oxidase [Pelagibacterium luteolum]|uniref:Glycine oxidase n=1 Tax=Pelagibacterium luteolum TaxID=440168 RepID=A0A1G7W1Q6_9HYPH|nr:glycine oxidase ThiO [Pelagibacterium luteolum]SDG65974.1 glycine oxidase [Pelagibacterium luteolum]
MFRSTSSTPLRATVIGAGVAGLTTALALAERGVAVEVVDRNVGLGPGSCSWHAGGMLAPWCEMATSEPIVGRLGATSLAWWRERFPGVVAKGTLVVAPARDLAELDRFARRTQHYEWLDEADLASLEPDLAGRFRKGLFFPDEGHLDPRRALAALVERLTALGAAIRFDTELEPEAARGDLVFDCRGLSGRTDMPALRGVRGEMALIRAHSFSLTRPVRLLHPRLPVYLVPRGDGVFMLGATMLESESKGPVSVRSMLDLLGAAFAVHPALGEAEIIEFGADLRPALPDNLPSVERAGRIIRVNGLFRHGFLLAPAIAQIAAGAALDPHLDTELAHANSA